MLLSLALLLQAGTPRPAPAAPQRPPSDPGVIAVEQRVTPAGVQCVFRGKVGGVRFGKNPGESWVSVPGAACRLSWRDNRIVASSAFDGRAGVHGVADAAPSERLNRILWHDARGWRTPYPAVKQSLFFPMSIGIADEDRDEVEERGER